jgi:hypothetical protein
VCFVEVALNQRTYTYFLSVVMAVDWRELFKKSPCSNPPIHCSYIMILGVKEWKNKSFKAVI